MIDQTPVEGRQPPESLYVHIPFCPAKCPYCAFVTHIGSLKLADPYIDALIIETERLIKSRRGHPLETVYFGGGTPSMLTPEQIGRYLDSVRALIPFDADIEVTLEAHPSTVTLDTLLGLRRAGINRISFGGESLQSNELLLLGRQHRPERVGEAVGEARAAGFASINVDLMYGVPAQTVRSWKRSLRELIAIEPDHVSLYPLSVEPATVFGLRSRRGQLVLPAEDRVVEMYHLACDLLRSAGYGHYEVANWARPGYESRHNLAYWHNRDVYAVGVGAHGYLHPVRTENMRGVSRYIDRIRREAPVVDTVVRVDSELERTETIMLQLRLLAEGLDLDMVRERFGVELREPGDELRRLSDAGLVRVEGNRIFLEEAAVPVANEVWERLAV